MTEQLTQPRQGLNVSTEFDALMSRLDDIVPLIRQDAAEIEANQRLTPEVEAAIVKSGVLRMSTPLELGGYEFSPLQIMQAVEKLSYADGSTGWIAMAVAQGTGPVTAFMDPAAQSELFGDLDNPARIAGHGTRFGTAVEVEGGHRVSGSWNFCSGYDYATHIYSTATVQETGQIRMFIVPKEKTKPIGNWDVMGLRATNSIDYDLEDVFVPERYSYDLMHPMGTIGGGLYRMGQGHIANIVHYGFALGIGRRLLDEMKAIAVKKHGTAGATVDTSEFHAAYAWAEADYRAASALVREVWQDIEATVDRNESLSDEQETMGRLSLTNITRAMYQTSQVVFKWAGSSALRHGDLNRVIRDAHAANQHLTSGPVVHQNCGRMLAGQTPGAKWLFLSLVEEA